MSGLIQRFQSDSFSFLLIVMGTLVQQRVPTKGRWRRVEGTAHGTARLNVNMGEQEVA